MFLNTLSPRFYVALTGTSSLISGLILIFEYWYFKRYGRSFIEQLSLAQFFPLPGIGEDDNDSESVDSATAVGPPAAASQECKITRNPYSLFRGAEYQRYFRAYGRDPLTYYDMNLSAQHHQTFFTCDADAGQVEYEVMQLAWRERNHDERIHKAKEALTKNPNCATAMILLAEEECSTIVECERTLKQALKCAEASLRQSQQSQQQLPLPGCTLSASSSSGGGGHHQHATTGSSTQQASATAALECIHRRDLHVCVFIRRRLAMCARKLGKFKEAIKLMKDLIKEHPNFNLFNIHENLMECYLASQQYADAQAFLSKYDDCRYPKSATIWYTSALLKARQVADKFSPEVATRRGLSSAESYAIDAIQKAIEFNPHVPLYLLEMKPLILPTEHILKRGDSEAIAYAFNHLAHWKALDGVLNMLYCTWEGTFQLLPQTLERGNTFYPYPTTTSTADRDLLPDFHTVSVYPKKEFPILLASIVILFILLGSAATLTYAFPEQTATLTKMMVSFTRSTLYCVLGPINYALERLDIMSRVFPSGTA